MHFLAAAEKGQFQISPEPYKPFEITRKMMWSFVQLPLRTIYDSIGGYVVRFGIFEVLTESQHRPMHFAGRQYTLFQIIRERCKPLKFWNGTLYSVTLLKTVTFPVNFGTMRTVLMVLKWLLGVN